MTDQSAPLRAYLPWVRQGLGAALALADDSPGPGTADVPLRVWVNEPAHADPNRSVQVPIALYGPGDVTGLDPAQVVRTYPPHLSGDAEPPYFPAIDFDRPDLPWLFTPRRATAENRLRPWLVLVTVTQADSGLGRVAGATLPVLDCALAELPDLSESWAWAHAQVVRPNGQVSIGDTFTGAPERTVSRLLCPRRLEAGTAYRACVVPGFAAGRQRGLGKEPAADADLAPAWPLTDDGSRVKLPVYYFWEFTTGAAGDFETLARRLTYQEPSSSGAGRTLDLSEPGWGLTGLPTRIVDAPAALSVPLADPLPWPANEREIFAEGLRAAVSADPGAPDVRPPVYGAAAAGVADADVGAPEWLEDINLDPTHRMAAGLGAFVVQLEQEQLVADAWSQLPSELAAVQRSRAEVAAEVTRSVTQRHLLPLPSLTFLQATEPLRRGPTVREELGRSAFHASSPSSGEYPAQLSAVYRRLTPRRMRVGSVPAVALATAQPGRVVPAVRTELLEAVRPIEVARVAALTVRPRVDNAGPAGRFTPRYRQPAYELLRDYAPDLLLPGAADVPLDSVSLLETNPRFIEAFLVGMNEELAGELLWRGYPTDPRGTYFSQFWSRGDIDGRNAELPDVQSWAPSSRLGEHLSGNETGVLVLMIRGDLLRRFPRTLLYAVEAARGPDGSRVLGSETRPPLFSARWGLDISLFGFSLNVQQARGSTDRQQHPGWWFVVSEPPEEARFGLDESTRYGETPATWDDLAWGQLAADEPGLRALAHVPVGGRLSNLELDGLQWGTDAATMAMITEQRPFRVAVHASHWLPPRAVP